MRHGRGPSLINNVATTRICGAVLEQIGLPRPYAESKPLTIAELDLAPSAGAELLVRIEAARLCHSDLSVVDGSRVRPVPMLFGHEAAGIVAHIGDGASDLAVGQRAVMTFLPRCGGERRLSPDGLPVHHHLGVSGFATHTVIDRASMVPVDSDVPPVLASLLGCAVLTGGGAVLNVGKPQPGQSVILVALGGVGMAAILTALAYDDVRVVGVDQLAHKAYTPDQARERGLKATIVMRPSAIRARWRPRST